MNVGEALIDLLEQAGVDTVFGIPGVHTIELYRGLANSSIRHITPRHEQGAAFMADGYARATAKPGVCLLITGPGLTNAITAMAQARADSIPMLVITGVNPVATHNKDYGHLHELPDQSALAKTVALRSYTLTKPEEISEVIARAFHSMTAARPGPVHIEIPTDIMTAQVPQPTLEALSNNKAKPSNEELTSAVSMCVEAENPTIICGGGSLHQAPLVRHFAELLGAPTVSTINARGIMARSVLDVPASPSLGATRDLLEKSDLVIALGTELGPTDFDMYETGMPLPSSPMIRVDIDDAKLAHSPPSTLAIKADVGAFIEMVCDRIAKTGHVKSSTGGERAKKARALALEEIGEVSRRHIDLIAGMWRTLPNATLVGDSTQLAYAGNLFVTAPRPGAWFNSATGFGTLGYSAPAAIGASLGKPGEPVLSLIGDGGLQFTLAELGSARDCDADVAFIVWNNRGYREIETSMISAQVRPVGVTPTPPDFTLVAQAYGLPATRVESAEELYAALQTLQRPCLIEFMDSEA